jgi:uncharacterized protein (TIGR02452 family)
MSSDDADVVEYDPAATCDPTDTVVATKSRNARRKTRAQPRADLLSHAGSQPPLAVSIHPDVVVIDEGGTTDEGVVLFLEPSSRKALNLAPLDPLERYDMHSEYSVPHAKAFRRSVWDQTEQIGKAGGYQLPGVSTCINLTAAISASQAGARRFALPTPLPTLSGRRGEIISVRNCDCLVAAEEMTARGVYTMVADAGSRSHFGGNYKGGARAQEEEMIRRSTLAFAMSMAHRAKLYPLPPAEGVYIPDVVVFRRGVSNSYALLKRPFRVAFGIVAAYRQPELVNGRLTGVPLADTAKMCRTFFSMAAANGHRGVVVVPVGCGAFGNPASHLAELFWAPLFGTDGGPPLLTYFDEVCFAILEDHNSQHGANPDGNLKPFIEAFRHYPGTRLDEGINA